MDDSVARFLRRFWKYVDRQGDDECWLWKGSLNANGYGSIKMDEKTRPAHRVAYWVLVGPIPPDPPDTDPRDRSVIDHLCRVRHCVNPKHLELVTAAENSRRAGAREKCRRGHEYTEENTYIIPGTGGRSCRTCREIMSRKYREGEAYRAAKKRANAELRARRARESRPPKEVELAEIVWPRADVGTSAP